MKDDSQADSHGGLYLWMGKQQVGTVRDDLCMASGLRLATL